MFQSKWYNSSKDLQEGDLVYFQKEEGALETPWVIGIVEQVVRSRDQKVRRIVIKYQNREENRPRFTDRASRKIVKLFNVDEFQVQEDLVMLQKRIDELQGIGGHEDNVQNDELIRVDDVLQVGLRLDPVVQRQAGEEDVTGGPARNTRSPARGCNSCCVDHCNLAIHSTGNQVVLEEKVLVPCLLEDFKLFSYGIPVNVIEEDVQEEEELEKRPLM